MKSYGDIMVDRPVDQSHLECNKISLASHLKCNALHFSLTQIIENTQCASLGFKPKSTAGHFHAWTVTDETSVATVHVSPAEGTDPLSLPPLVSAWLKERYAIDHVTVQVDPPGKLNTKHD